MKKIYCLLFTVWVMTLFSCQVEKYNADPNNPMTVSPQVLLPDVLFYSCRNGNERECSLLTRYTVGVSDIQDWQTYNLPRGSFSQYDQLRNITKMQEACAGNPQNNAYLAIAHILRVHNFYTLTMLYGDVPYSEAPQGENMDKPVEERFYPSYDRQKSIFIGLLNELEEANQLLKDESLTIEGDIIYEGDIKKWRKLANSYKLKILIMLSNRTDDADLKPAEAFARIIADPLNYPIFESEEEQAQLDYLNSQGVMYPCYNDLDMRNKRFIGDVICDLLVSLKDPRLFVFAQPAVSFSGEIPADDFRAYKGLDASKALTDVSADAATGEYSRININRYTSDPVGEPALFLSYSELMLAKAEAAVRGWISADASLCYQEAIRASFNYYGCEADYEDYVVRNAFDENRGLEQICQQRYILFFMQGDYESWFHALRTGYPHIECGKGQMVSQLPYRLRYPQNEIDVNQEHMEEALSAQGFQEDASDQKPWIY